MSGAFTKYRSGLLGAVAFASLLASVSDVAQHGRQGQQPPAQPPPAQGLRKVAVV